MQLSATYVVVDGIESQFYGDHLSPFLFTNLILPRIRAAASPEFSPRIVNISSVAHQWSEVHFDDISFGQGAEYDRIKAYGQAKAANILFTLELAKKLAPEGILSFSVHPGSELLVDIHFHFLVILILRAIGIWTNTLDDIATKERDEAIKLGTTFCFTPSLRNLTLMVGFLAADGKSKGTQFEWKTLGAGAAT